MYRIPFSRSTPGMAGTPSRLLKAWGAAAAVAALVVLAAVALPLTPQKAFAEPVSVPYIDRLGCGTTDAAVTPVFSWAGGGTAAAGRAYNATTAASAYPATAGAFSGVVGAPGYTTYSPAGYGSDFQYRGTGALGFAPVNPGVGATLSIQVPHAQGVQFTVGGMQVPSQLQISGTGPDGAVAPSAAARSSEPGSATATQTGSSVLLNGAVNDGSADGSVRNAVDVWFSAPVSTITITLSTAGAGLDSGFLVTAPIACQSGSVSTTASVGPAQVDTAVGRVSHTVTMLTTVANTSPASGAVLYPAVALPLRRAVEAQGMSLESVVASSNSAAACVPAPGLDGSGVVIAPSASGLAPGSECTLEWTATVSMPQSTVDRAVTLDSSLRSSSAIESRLKAQTSSSATFPGLVSSLAVSGSGATQAQPGQSINRSVTVANNGPGAALDTSYSLTAPQGVTLSNLPASCSTVGSIANCAVGNITPGGTINVDYTLTIASSVAPGSSLSVDSDATSPAQSTGASFTYAVSVVAEPVPPVVQPPVVQPPVAQIPPPAQRPRPPAPSPAPTPRPTPTAAPTAVPEVSEPVTTPPAPATPVRVPVPLSLSFAAGDIQPGTVSTLRGTLGPVVSEETVALSLTGRVNQGLVYRLVRIIVDGVDRDACVTQSREFTCTLTLKPGERAEVEVRLFADALNSPGQAIQQLALKTGDGSGDNARTVTTSVASEESDTDAWTAAFTLNMSTLEGAFLPLTAMLLLALAATVAERRRT